MAAETRRAVFCLVILWCGFFQHCDACGAIYFSRTGTVKSPNYPSHYRNSLSCTWIIIGPNPYSRIHLKFDDIRLEGPKDGNNDCFDSMKVTSTNESLHIKDFHGKYCGSFTDLYINSTTSVIKIEMRTDSSVTYKGFLANYNISDYEFATTTTTSRPCMQNEITCPNGRCISSHNLCYGVNDCLDYWDEDCWRAPWNKTGVVEYLDLGRQFLQRRLSDTRGKDLARIVTTFQLIASNLDAFPANSTSPMSLAASMLEVDISTAALRNDTTLMEGTGLAFSVLALKSICHDPQNFYGLNLTERLASTDLFDPNPFLSVALCVADLDLSEDHIYDLQQIATKNPPENTYDLDMKATAILALVCAQRRGQQIPEVNLTALASELAVLQDPDTGSFGGLHSSALVGQALLSLKSDYKVDWSFFKLVEFLKMKKSDNTSFTNIPALTMSLPVFAGRSYLDLSDSACPQVSRTRRTPVVGSGSTLRVTYSLWLEEQREAAYTVHYRLPAHHNTTFFDLFKMASNENEKFRATWKIFPWGPTVFSINNVFNQPQDQIYWRLFLLKDGTVLRRVHQRLDQVYLEDGDHYVFWRTSTIQ